MDELDIISATCTHTKDEESKKYLRMKFSAVLQKDRAKALAKG
jgi:hypothetical protein